MLIDINKNKELVKAKIEEQYGEQPALQRVDQVIKQQLKLVTRAIDN